jgi:hypothetical protein
MHLLKQTQTRLKEHFIGLDPIIDEVFQLMQTWYCIPEVQPRPIVINLWGVTGTGKSDLVRRIVNSLHFEDRFFHFDMGEVKNQRTPFIADRLGSFLDQEHDSPMIVCLDEFQKARTVNELEAEDEDPAMRSTWELLDTGTVSHEVYHYSYREDQFFSLIRLMEYARQHGIKVEQGRIVSKPKTFLKLERLSFNELSNDRPSFAELKEHPGIPLIHPSFYSDLFSYFRDEFEHIHTLKLHLLSLNLTESIRFVQRAYRASVKPKISCARKALIFVVGNLDEAFHLNSISADLDADQVYESSLKVTVSHIKRALQTRFKNEQIARLGNNHIIYPTISKYAYKKLIENTLRKRSESLMEKSGVHSTFSETYKNLIYSEGVYPTQGARPVLSSIQTFYESVFPSALVSGWQQNEPVKTLHFDYDRKEIVVSANSMDICRHKPSLPLEDIRNHRKTHAQALIAVHESGHGILYAMLYRAAPLELRSVTTDFEQLGSAILSNKDSIQTLEDLKRELIVHLGGLIAEELIFGKEHSTKGSRSDLKKATVLANEMILQFGLDERKSFRSFDDFTRYDSLPNFKEDQIKVQQLLDEAFQKGKGILEKEIVFLLELSDYLSTQPRILPDAFLEMAAEFGSAPLWKQSLKKEHQQYPFRDILSRRKKALKQSKINNTKTQTV